MIMRFVIAALIVFAAACGEGSVPSESAATTTVAPAVIRYPVTIDQTGGCMMMGPNCVRYIVDEAGAATVFRLGLEDPELVAVTTIDRSLIDALSTALHDTELGALRSRLGPGECMGCVDGIDTTVTFTVDGEAISFNSIDKEFDQSEPVFAALASIIEAAAVVDFPLMQHRDITVERDASIYAAVVKQLVEVDDAFGGQSTFATVLVVDHTDAGAGNSMGDPASDRPLTDLERAAILEALPDHDVQFIADPDGYRKDLQPVIEGSVILTLGPILFEPTGTLVDTSLWCGGLCGQWLTYRMAQQDSDWVVDGIEGPIAMS